MCWLIADHDTSNSAAICPAESSRSQTSSRMRNRRGEAITCNPSIPASSAAPARSPIVAAGLDDVVLVRSKIAAYAREDTMDRSITLAVDVAADVDRAFDILSTTEGQRAFWTADCDVSSDSARFGFAQAPVDLETSVTSEPGRLVRMRVTSGFPYWEGSTWEWELGPAARADGGTGVLFRHYGFGDGYPEVDLGHTAQTWAQILDRLVRYADTGNPEPLFPAAAA